MDQGVPMEHPSSDKSYAFTGKIMLSAIVILFTVVLLMVCIHLYARWYVIRLRRRRRPTVIYLDHHQNHNSSAIIALAAADRGLDVSVLNSLPIFRYAASPATEKVVVECAVCLSEFEEDEVVRLLPKCGHTFHVDCIGMWFHSHSTCPLCRSAVEVVVSLSDPPPQLPEEAIEEGIISRSEESSSSWERELCATCQHESGNSKTTSSSSSLWGRRKSIGGGMLGIRIEVPGESSENGAGELSHGSSPGGSSRLLSLKRLFSMTKKTPTGSSTAGGGELDLEAGGRVETPRLDSVTKRGGSQK